MIDKPVLIVEPVVILFIGFIDTLIVILAVVVTHAWNNQSVGEVLYK
jgi:hypothetical protein